MYSPDGPRSLRPHPSPARSSPSPGQARSLARGRLGRGGVGCLAAACVLLAGASEAAAQALPTTLPEPPAGSTCLLLQRGTLGEVHDADLSAGNGDWAAGAYPYTFTGLSTAEHWSLHRFDLSPVPEGVQVVLAAFTAHVGWNDQSSEVRLHRILVPWEELTVTWPNFGGTASWDPATITAFNPNGVGHKTVDVTALVQGWRSGQIPNHGFLMEETPIKRHGFFGSESSDIEKRPSLYVCYMAGGACAGLAEGAACDDDNLCTTGETCQAGQCTGGVLTTCTPLDECHEEGVCDPATGQCTAPEKPDGAPCSDGDLCTTGDQCVAGLCVGPSPVSCLDGSACTTDVCEPGVGCSNQTVSCDDENACTADSCDAVSGCAHEPVTCDDGDACTADECDPVSGCSIAPISCDDGDPCTADGCDSETGCFHVPSSGAACPAANGTGVCDLGTCGIAACDPGWGNCDCSLSNGCETDLTSDPESCGVCGLSCATAGGTGLCVQGTCVVQ